MVKLEEVEDDTYPPPGTIEDDDGWGTDNDSDSDVSDISEGDEPSEESIADRIYALKDMIPPTSRRRIGSAASKGYSWGSWGLGSGLTLAWQISTSVLLLVIPFSLVMMEDQAIAVEEQQMRQREMGNDVSEMERTGGEMPIAWRLTHSR